MNNITITHELCTEDRARLDRLTAALEALQPPTVHVNPPIRKNVPEQMTIADVEQKLAEAMAKASDPAEPPKNTTEEAETSTPSTTQTEEEKPVVEEPTPAEETAEPTVTLEEIQQKVVQLAAANGGAKKAKVREIVNAHAKKVSDLPEDKWADVWNQLVALESEA